VETGSAWAAVWGLGTPPAPTWRLDPASLLGIPLHIHGA